MARYASRLLGLVYSADEQVACIAENDACSVDAIQVMLGCSIGKGDLIGSMFEWMRAFHGAVKKDVIPRRAPPDVGISNAI